jgi:predicted GIY-YIG superfamily endonuclease
MVNIKIVKDKEYNEQIELLKTYLESNEKFCIDILSLNYLIDKNIERRNLSASIKSKKYEENVDYIIQKNKNPHGGKEKIDYKLTIDCFIKFLKCQKYANSISTLEYINNYLKNKNNTNDNINDKDDIYELNEKLNIVDSEMEDTNSEMENTNSEIENTNSEIEDINSEMENEFIESEKNDENNNDDEDTFSKKVWSKTGESGGAPPEDNEKFDISYDEIKKMKKNHISEIKKIQYDFRTNNILNIETFMNKSVIYLLHVKDDIYKFGMTDDVIDRFSRHQKALNYQKELRIAFSFNKSISRAIELELIQFITYNKNLFIQIPNRNEMFKTKNIDIFIDKLNSILDSKYSDFSNMIVANNTNKLSNKQFFEFQDNNSNNNFEYIYGNRLDKIEKNILELEKYLLILIKGQDKILNLFNMRSDKRIIDVLKTKLDVLKIESKSCENPNEDSNNNILTDTDIPTDIEIDEKNQKKCNRCNVKRIISEFTTDGKIFSNCNGCRKAAQIRYNLKENESYCKGCCKIKDKNEFIIEINGSNRSFLTCNTCRTKDNEIKKKMYSQNKDKILLRNSLYYAKEKDSIIENKKQKMLEKEYQGIKCSKCNKDLPPDKFDIKDEEKNIRYSQCNDCRQKDKEYQKKKKILN